MSSYIEVQTEVEIDLDDIKPQIKKHFCNSEKCLGTLTNYDARELIKSTYKEVFLFKREVDLNNIIEELYRLTWYREANTK